MHSIRKEFQNQQQCQSEFRNNFQDSCGVVARRFTLFHTLQYLIHVKNQLNQRQQENKQLSIQDVKPIRQEDSALKIARNMSETLQNIYAEKKQNQSSDKITDDDIFEVVLSAFKGDFIEILILFVVDALCRLTFSVLIIYLFQAVEERNLTIAYIYTGGLTLLWYLSQLLRQEGTIITSLLVNQIKAGLTSLIYAKISSLNSYSIKGSSIGKITNLLSNDLAAIEQQITFLTSSLAFPVFLIGSGVILVLRIGWAGIAGIVIIILFIPLSSKISELNSEIVKEVNSSKDQRVQITTQTIQNIKSVKLYGWEFPTKKMILSIREKQLWSLKKLALGKAFERALGYFISFIASLVMIIVAYYLAGIDFPKIFSVLEIMSSLKVNVLMFVLGMGLYYEIKVIFARFASIFNLENKSMIHIDTLKKEQNRIQEEIIEIILTEERMLCPESEKYLQNIERETLKKGQIRFHKFNGFWSEDFEKPHLNNITTYFQSGKLYGLTGKVSSGKSSLLAAIIGEMAYYSGKIELEGSIAYVEQEPIIFSDTLKNNIVFGQQFNEVKYNRTIKMSCLESDFILFEKGDETIVGDKGVTLSGGQKARLALARAVYAGANIYLLDDPLSAVDSKVAKQIFMRCIKLLSRSKTVILSTHQIHYIQDCDEVLIMQKGSISISGSPQSLKTQLEELKSSEKEEQKENNEDDPFSIESSQFVQQFKSSVMMIKTESNRTEGINLPHIPQLRETVSMKFREKEANVSTDTYKNFFLAVNSNYVLLPLTFILFVVTEVITAAYYRFLADFQKVENGSSPIFGNDLKLFWIVLSLLLIAYFIILVVKYFCLNLSVLHSSEVIHQDMISSIVLSPSQFFDVTPSGILVTKFSNDLGIVDKGLMHGLVQTVEGPVYILVAIVNLCQINLYFMIPSAVFLLVTFLFFKYSRPVIIACKQLDLRIKAPIFHFIGESMAGSIQIRVYQLTRKRMQNFLQIMNKSTKAVMSFQLVSRGFGFYSTIFSIILMWIGMFMGILQSNQQNSALYAVSIIYLITISERIRRVLKQFIVLDSSIVSAERIMELQHLHKEKPFRNQYDREVGLVEEVEAEEKGEDCHLIWPAEPKFEIKNLSVRYKEGLPLALNNFSFKASSGEKIGIVGRTGSGKSTIIQTLFRLYEPELGSLYTIDSYDALKMGMHSLRQHLSVIPQVPFIFKGTIKQNLDPFETVSQDELWSALEETGLKDHIQSLPAQLQTQISPKSQTFSVGEKQLLCLCRTLVRKNKFLILDEATSNVDMQTDSVIQGIIKRKFKDTTVITIAHRLNTIADYDRILVMDEGKLIEEGAPYELIQKKGLFYKMVKMAGRSSEEIRNKARNSYNDVDK